MATDLVSPLSMVSSFIWHPKSPQPGLQLQKVDDSYASLDTRLGLATHWPLP
jgi:hypothetical protein